MRDTSEIIRILSKFLSKLMVEVTIKVAQRRKLLFIVDNVSALYDLIGEDPRWKDFTTTGMTWVKRIMGAVTLQVADLEDLEVAESLSDFCIVLKNIDGIPYLKVTKSSTFGWTPYRITHGELEIAEDFL